MTNSDFIIIFGPPAVGKMAVGMEFVKLNPKFKLFHNHMTIELLLEFFEYTSSKFQKLNTEFRMRIFEEIASSDIQGFIFTFVWALNENQDKKYVDQLCDFFQKQNWKIHFVELEADLSERLIRNKGEIRLSKKQSKRDVIHSEKLLLKCDDEYVLNTNEQRPFFYTENYIKIISTNLSARETALEIKQAFNL